MAAENPPRILWLVTIRS